LSYQKERELHMLECPEPDHPDLDRQVDADPENTELGLPLSYRIETLHRAGLSNFTKLEAKLR
jgi:hypothetical protein